MPCLVQVTMTVFGNRRQYDVTLSKPVDFVPGSKEVENALSRYGFFYITDREWDDPDLVWLVEDVSDDEPLQRVRRPNVSAAPGQINRFLTYHPWGVDGSTVPNNVKFTWAQVSAFVENHT